MKQSIYNQELNITGSVRTVKGIITVTMNYTTETYTYNNISTHDSEKMQRRVHKVEGFVDGNLHWKKFSLKSEHEVLSEVEACKNLMTSDMQKMANSRPIKTFTEKMNDLGFKTNP